MHPPEAAVLENYKENIIPLPGGRPAGKLAARLGSSSSRSSSSHKDLIKKEREAFEISLHNLEEQDDPLQTFVEYISWTHNNYPQGNNSESGLLTLLEKCTSCFRDEAHYKNDPRYLKVWMEYTNYSDSPRDIFVYLARKEIGNQLALYYEEFANYLEVNGKENDARQIYELGLENQARPKVRLERSFQRFKNRLEGSSSPQELAPAIRNALAMKRGEVVASVDTECDPSRKKPKLEVFKDESVQNQSVLYSIFNGSTDIHDLGTIKSRIKENTIQSKPWSGEVMKQRALDRQSSSGGSSAKFQVYRDDAVESHPSDEPRAAQRTEVGKDGKVFTIIQNPGKRTENVLLNIDLLYPSMNEEYCMEEILAMTRMNYKTSTENEPTPTIKPFQAKDIPKESSRIGKTRSNFSNNDINDIENLQIKHNLHEQHQDDETTTFTVPLREEAGEELPQSPTMTMFSKMANREVMNLFNEAAQNMNSEDEEEKLHDLEHTATNYDGFVTETIQLPINDAIQNVLEPIETPPTDKEDFGEHSSPFIEQPSLFDNSGPRIVNPVDPNVREQLLNSLSIPLTVYPGFNADSKRVTKMQSFKDITHKLTRTVSKGSSSAMINFCGDEMYCLRHEIGRGGYGFVYLIETGTTGDLKALKIESPSSKWEFYILSQINRRLIGKDRATSALVVKPESLFYFKDESYLFMDYYTQGTILDIINYHKNKGVAVEEVLCIHLTIELLKSVETLHEIGIIHGDLKADNCMIRFNPVEDGIDWNESYSFHNSSPWLKKSITLIDFGRAIDLTMFSPNTQFVSDWKTDEQDCPQMNDHEPWSYEADYYGLASIIHTMLFGSYIKIKKHYNDRIALEGTFKRYWQHDLWNPLFELLLNAYEPGATRKKPLLEELRFHRSRLQDWLVKNSKAKNLKRIIIDVEHDLNVINKKRVG